MAGRLRVMGVSLGLYVLSACGAGHGPSSEVPSAASIGRRAAAPAWMTLAQAYRGDIGIAGDPSVVWVERFDEGSTAAVMARYDSYTDLAGMTLVPDRPASSSGTHALELTAGGANPATGFYVSFGKGYDELYFRYYVKYVGNGPWHHAGLWIGGYDPPLSHPYPRAGHKPAGNDYFSLGLEPISDAAGEPMDLYTYWRGMHSWRKVPTGAAGDYWGNTLLHDPEFRMRSDAWVCYEIHLRLNPDPPHGAGAVLEVWENDRLIRRFDDAGPDGFWVRDKFCPDDAHDAVCTDYRPAKPLLVPLDQQWRSTAALKINYFWPQNYNDAGASSSILMDDIVVATRRVGCTVKR